IFSKNRLFRPAGVLLLGGLQEMGVNGEGNGLFDQSMSGYIEHISVIACHPERQAKGFGL
ncbi:MAG: hypothetical protein KKF43_06570, partial [Proteobacteria bacterium]|nr:hypothetical protein [Pseudomonadota bacterium]